MARHPSRRDWGDADASYIGVTDGINKHLYNVESVCRESGQIQG